VTAEGRRPLKERLPLALDTTVEDTAAIAASPDVAADVVVAAATAAAAGQLAGRPFVVQVVTSRHRHR